MAWHQEKYVEHDETEPTVFDPYDYNEVFPSTTTGPEETTEATEEG